MDRRELSLVRPPDAGGYITPVVFPPRDVPVRRRGTIPGQATPRAAERRSSAKFKPHFDGLVKGDERAWADWIRHLTPQLKRIASRKVRNPSDVEDVVQDTWAEVYKEIIAGKVENINLDAFVRASLIHTILDGVRRASRRPTISDNEIVPDTPSPHDVEDITINRISIVGRLGKSIEELSEEDRDQIGYILQDFSAEDIANLLGIRPGAARTRRSRAIERLRNKSVPQE